MDLRHLRYFVAVAEELHFGHAAERLHIAQPPLSQQIKQLETEIGVTLLLRTKRHVELTPAGAVFLAEARTTLAQADEAVVRARTAHQIDADQLLLGFIDGAVYFCLPHLLRAYQRAQPDVHISLHGMTSGQQLEALESGAIQVGILRPMRAGPRVVFEELSREQFVVAMYKGHRLAGEPAITLEALQGERFVFFRRALATGLHDHMMGMFKKAGYSPNIVQEADEARTLLGLVAAGVGLFLTTESFRGWGGDDIVYKAIVPASAWLPVALAWRANDRSAAVRAFISTAREVIKSGVLDHPAPPGELAGLVAAPASTS
jgi:DNA-binding transcriptional LysR family regulator